MWTIRRSASSCSEMPASSAYYSFINLLQYHATLHTPYKTTPSPRSNRQPNDTDWEKQDDDNCLLSTLVFVSSTRAPLMRPKTDTAGTDDAASDDWHSTQAQRECHSSREDPSAGESSLLSPADTTKAASADASLPAHKKPWPVDAADGGTSVRARLRNLSRSLTYSYMNPILQQGRNQFQSNDHLTMQNIFAVPPWMRSEVLVADFW